jgi:hypothetical protein
MERAQGKLRELSMWEERGCCHGDSALEAVEEEFEGQGLDESQECTCGAEQEEAGGWGGLAMVCCPKTIRTLCKKCKIHQVGWELTR